MSAVGLRFSCQPARIRAQARALADAESAKIRERARELRGIEWRIRAAGAVATVTCEVSTRTGLFVATVQTEHWQPAIRQAGQAIRKQRRRARTRQVARRNDPPRK